MRIGLSNRGICCRRRGLYCVSDDDEDETAELQRELEKIKRERAEKREQEVRLHIWGCGNYR